MLSPFGSNAGSRNDSKTSTVTLVAEGVNGSEACRNGLVYAESRFLKPFSGTALDLRIVAKPRQPVNSGLFAEPRQLAFGVVPRAALNGREGVF